MVKLLFIHFRVTNSNLKNIKLHFELLTQSMLILEIVFPVLFECYQEKTSLFFRSTTTSNYLYIINRYCCTQFCYQFSVIVVLIFRDTQRHSLMERKKKIIVDLNKIYNLISLWPAV